MTTKIIHFVSLLAIPVFAFTSNSLFPAAAAEVATSETQTQISVPNQESLVVAGEYNLDFDRVTSNGKYDSKPPPPPPPPPPVPKPEPKPEPEEVEPEDESFPPAPSFTPDPGSAQEYALTAVTNRGWDATEFNCLVSLWNKESGWRANAQNPSSGAYGIPQALPGNKMAAAGADWQTNANTQIEWGLMYIADRYGSPCGAWEHSQAVNWY